MGSNAADSNADSSNNINLYICLALIVSSGLWFDLMYYQLFRPFLSAGKYHQQVFPRREGGGFQMEFVPTLRITPCRYALT